MDQENIKKGNKRGRKNKYDTHVKPYFDKIYYWLRDGLLEEEICKRLDIGVSTFNEYKLQYVELVELLKEGKQEIDYKVEDSLLKRARGYQHDEVTRELITKTDAYGNVVYDENGLPVKELQVTKIVTKEVVPDTTAQIFWLKNRQPEKWEDKHKQEVNIAGKLEDYF